MTAGGKQFTNVVIRASAGTGKTFQLSNRFIALAADGRPLDAILASTFTRKAAGEILARVLSRLADAALDDRKAADLAKFVGDVTFDRRRALELLKEMVRQLHRLRVGTLDGFFMQIARSFSLELDLPPAWQVVDEVIDARIRNAAVRDMLASAATDDAVRMMHLLTKGEASRSISDQISDLVNSLYSTYLEAPPAAWQSLKRLKTLPAEEIETRLVELEAAALPADKRFAKARGEDLARFRAEQWEEFIATGLAGKVADGSLKYYNKEIPAPVVEIYEALAAHAKASIINAIANQTQATHDLLSRFDRGYRRLKASQRAMRFEDVTRSIGGDWLDEHVDEVLYRLDSHLLHMLLDEFQDTSLVQWRILRPFARRIMGRGRERSFFCVGDVKQAIYGWRGGVAEIFEALDGELVPRTTAGSSGSVGNTVRQANRGTHENGGLTHESLDVSRRSSRPVIETVNKTFEHIVANPALQSHASAAVAWGGRFRRHDTARGELPGYCRLSVAPGAEEDQKQGDVTLGCAAEEIKRLREQSPGADVAVLVRTNNSVGRMIHELRSRGLAASEEGGNPLSNSPAVTLILSLLRLADHPGDTAARFHLAASPLGRVLDFTRHDDAKAAARLAADVRARLINDGYGPTIDGFARSLREFCDGRDLGRLDQLVDLAYAYEQEATARPCDFVEIVERRRIEDPTSARLRVMTVHQAKGLQFDIVVLPELDFRLSGQPDMVAVGRAAPTEPICHVCRHVAQKTRVILPDALVGMFEEQERRDVEESLCLLYVALTRAVHALYAIVAPSKPNEKNLPATFAGILRGALCTDAKPAEAETVLFEHGERQWFVAAGKQEACGVDAALREAPMTTQLTLKFAPLAEKKRRGLDRRSPSELEGGPRVDLAARLRLDTSAALARGTLVHAWFEQIGWLDDGEPDDAALLAIAARHGFSPEQSAGYLVEFSRTLAQAAVRDALSRQTYKGRRVQVWRERPFAVADGDAILSGSIDRLVISYDGDRPTAADVIDFKTDAVFLDSPQALAERIEHYRPQLEAYRRAVCELTGLPAEKVTLRLLFTQAGCIACL